MKCFLWVTQIGILYMQSHKLSAANIVIPQLVMNPFSWYQLDSENKNCF